MFGAGLAQRLGRHAALVGVDPDQDQPQRTAQGIDALIGHAVGQHGIAAVGEAAQCTGDAVLCAFDDQHLRGLGLDAGVTQPLRRRLPGPQRTFGRMVVLHVAKARVAGQARQQLGQDPVEAVGGRAIDAQVDRARGIARCRLKLRGRMPRLRDLGSASRATLHQALLLQHRHGLGYRGDVHPQGTGKVAMGRQAFAGFELAIGNRISQRISQLRIEGFGLVTLQGGTGLQFIQQLFELTHGALSLLSCS
ncbi:hypothetical protein D3C76_638260 [compost metagenome]